MMTVITGFTHKNERVMNAEQNRLVGKMTNNELALLAHREQNRSKQNESLAPLIKEVSDLKNITKSRPLYLGQDYDNMADMVTKRVLRGQTMEKTHRKSGGIWGRRK